MNAFSTLSLLSRLAFRNLLRNRKRSSLTLLAVAVGVGSSVVLAALARGMGEQITRDAIYTMTGHIQVRHPSYTDDPSIEYRFALNKDTFETIASLSTVTHASPRLRVPAVIMSERESRGLTFIGIEPRREEGLSLAGDKPILGRPLQDGEDSGLLVGKKLLEKLKTKLGRRVVITTQDKENNISDRGFRIVGVFDAELDSTELSYVFTGIQTAQELTHTPNEMSEISILTPSLEIPEELLQSIEQHFPNEKVTIWKEIEPLIVSLVSIQNGFLIFWFLIVIIAIGLGLMNSLFMSIYERARELGLMQALGMKPNAIVMQTVLESFFLLLLGAAMGIGLGILGVHLLQGGIDISAFAEGASIAGISSMVYPDLLLSDIALLTTMLLFLGVLGSLYPAWHSSREHSLTLIHRGLT
ncbi:MAG: ABC transporter permease [Bdellovibrionales bacterium]|nr:ABC transporter permease [Bdellovibrionales bacterium]